LAESEFHYVARVLVLGAHSAWVGGAFVEISVCSGAQSKFSDSHWASFDGADDPFVQLVDWEGGNKDPDGDS